MADEDAARTETISDASEQKRLQKFKEITKRLVNKTLTEKRLRKFSNGLLSLKINPQLVESLIEEFSSSLETAMQDELQLMIREEDLERLFHDLDILTDSQTDSTTDAWRPSGIPVQDARCHIMEVKLHHRDELRKKLSELQTENGALVEDITSKRQQVQEQQYNCETEQQKYLQTLTQCSRLCEEAGQNETTKKLKAYLQ